MDELKENRSFFYLILILICTIFSYSCDSTNSTSEIGDYDLLNGIWISKGDLFPDTIFVTYDKENNTGLYVDLNDEGFYFTDKKNYEMEYYVSNTFHFDSTDKGIEFISRPSCIAILDSDDARPVRLIELTKSRAEFESKQGFASLERLK